MGVIKVLRLVIESDSRIRNRWGYFLAWIVVEAIYQTKKVVPSINIFSLHVKKPVVEWNNGGFVIC